MINNYLGKFQALGYTREELELLLEKINNNIYLSKDEYKKLIMAIEIIESLSTFDGSYNSLTGKPDVVDIVRQTNEFASTKELHNRLACMHKYIDLALENFQTDLAGNKADKDHLHDNRYSLLNHTHEDFYVQPKDLNDYVSKEYLETVLSGFSSGGGSGSIYPTYVQPKLTVKPNTSSITHKKSATVLLTPTYTQNDAGKATKLIVTRDGQTIYESSEIKKVEDTLTLKHGEKAEYVFTVQYGDGVIKDTTDGDPYPDTSIKAGTIVANVTISCYANSYIGTIADKDFESGDIEGLISVIATSKSYTYNFGLDNQKIVYMYPKSYGILNSIKDANGFEYIADSFEFLTVEYNGVLYNVYVLKNATYVETTAWKLIYS